MLENNERLRVLFFGDGHADNINPSSRKDDYLAASIEELNEGLETAKRRGCDAFVHLGDVFHRMEVSGECRNLVLATMMHDSEGNPWPFSSYVVVGNHDIRHNPQNLAHSALGTIIKAGGFKCVEEAPELGIGFGHFRDKIEDEIRAGILKNKPNVLIWAVHANVTVGEFYEDSDYIKFEEVPLDDNCRMLVAGHIHFPMEQEREDGTIYVNPGSACRNAATQDNITRIPRVLLVEYTLDGSYLDYQYIPLKTPRPAKEIFKLEEIQARKDKQQDTERFIQQISQMSMWTSDEDKYISLRKSGENKQINDRVVSLAIQTLRDVNDKRMVDK